MSVLTRFGIVLSLFMLLSACGDGDAEKPWDEGTTDDDTTITEEEAAAAIFLGSGSGTSFTVGVLDVALSTISAGGSTAISASLADADGNLYQETATVTFTSACSSAGLASLDSPVVVSGGIATTTYTASGCSGDDTITATSTVNDSTLTATGSITVQPASLGSLQFVSAIPSDIGINGLGLVEVSKVTFMILDTNGNPVANEEVTFELNTDVGGITLSDASATSDINGLVQVDVTSGTIATTVRVTATLVSNPLIKSQSDSLIISTGIADQNSMSVSAVTLNPEAWNFDGVTVGINVYAADHFNNPVPDGTAVSFTTEGGQVGSGCFIQAGGCSVTWTSSNPRPIDGRVTILASMIGEESFLDANGNGAFDAPDSHLTDMPEAFSDYDEDDVFDDGSEEFLDFNVNAAYDGSDSQFNGVLCCDAAAVADAVAAGEGLCLNVTPTSITCSDAKTIHVRGDIVLVMSGSGAMITYSNFVNNPTDLGLNTLNVAGGEGSVDVLITDVNGQVLPEGTTINFDSTNGDIKSRIEFTVQNTNVVPGAITISVAPTDNTDPGDESGKLQITVKTPKGVETYSDLITILD
ncbi:MAG: hypothetical protein ABFS39_00640 [Pseudomonadota bacterium]